jgi:predicted dehydrogenase
MNSLHRRDFLGTSSSLAAALAAGATLPTVSRAAKKADANDRLRVAVIGVRGRGMSHVAGFLGRPDVEITTVCDCDEAVIGKAMKQIEEKGGKAPRYEKDVRRVVEDKNIDILSIATPNHWHALMAIWGMQNGKDVYVEKPASHNVSEGRRMAEASRKFGRVCQVGTQSRSNPGMREAMAYLHDGKLGAVKIARGLCYKRRPSIGKVDGPTKPPATMDYDLWSGPAPLVMPTRKSVHYDWHWIWNYGNGDYGNQGVHEADKARWGLNKPGLPKNAFSLGGRFGYIDDGETPNTQVCVYDYGDAILLFEVRGLPTDSPHANWEGKKGTNFVGNIFHCEKGTLVLPNYSGGFALNPAGEVVAKFSGGGDKHHFDNFLKAVRSRKSSDLNCDIEEGHLSAALCHLANISYRLGTDKPFGESLSNVTSDKEVLATVGRMVEHLKSDDVDLTKVPLKVGRLLAVDAKSETFANDKEADALLTREYRKGFEVPAKL